MRDSLVLVLLLATSLAAEDAPAVVQKFFLDYSSGERSTNAAAESTATTVHPEVAHRSLVFNAPGQSEAVLKFNLPRVPSEAVLELEHLSSGGPVKLNGNSRISIQIDGETLVQDWEIGSHGFVTDRLHVLKFLRAGENTLKLQFTGGETTYWLKRMELQCHFPAGIDLSGKVERQAGRGSYAVVVSRPTIADAEWVKAVEALRKKYDATVLIHAGGVRDVREELSKLLPRYVCFVARPQELGRDYAIAVQRLMRALDADPYTDSIWGILTGYEAADALRLAECKEPLKVRRAAGGCGVQLEAFAEGCWYSESVKNEMWEKVKGRTPERKASPDDTTAALVTELNERKPDVFFTSGHATHRDWQIGFSYPNGQFRCQDGRLLGLDTAGKRFEIRSPNPKVYSPHGNCLMGLVEDRQSMALAWIHSAGVQQMTGYVVSTWFGYGGHGPLWYFVDLQGQFTFAESFYLSQQALVARLEREYPKTARVELDAWNVETHPGLLEQLAARFGIPSNDALGLLWDRDTVAFYGDPAWEARVEKVKEPAYEQRLTEKYGEWTFEVLVMREGSIGRPPAAIFTQPSSGAQVLEGAELMPVIADNFILLPLSGTHKKGEKFRVRFKNSRK